MPQVKLNADQEQVAVQFSEIFSVEQLAQLLGVEFDKHLVYYLYRLPLSKRYRQFELKKRKGGVRLISAPATSLKFIQQRLNKIFQAVYRPKAPVHGFVVTRGIVTNAERHVRKRYVLNVDLQDFFGTINFGRVRGLFMAQPHSKSPAIATILAQICCHNNALPQGAPTSPIVSNMICSRLDSQLQALARRNNCNYSRYADDLTFSWNVEKFPRDIATIDPSIEGAKVELGQALREIINGNGFIINEEKTRLRRRSERQEVTGLVVNKFINVDRRYVRNVRALLHACAKYGVSGAQAEYELRFAKSRFPGKSTPSIINVAYGRIQHIGSIRGWDDPVYQRLRNRFNEISPIKIPVPINSWFDTMNKACWLIEDWETDNQGTCFFLKDFGLVTCAHCVGPKPHIYHPSNPTQKYAVTIKKQNADIDLAILEVQQAPDAFAELNAQAIASEVQYQDDVTLLGYPGFALGKNLSIKTGEVQAFVMRSGIRRFNISAPIIAGNSGGPVLNRSNRVVGIAVTGADISINADATEYGVIPVTALDYLAD